MGDEELEQLAEAIDEACVPVLEEAVAPHLPALRDDLRALRAAGDAAACPSAEEIIERMRANGLEDPGDMR